MNEIHPAAADDTSAEVLPEEDQWAQHQRDVDDFLENRTNIFPFAPESRGSQQSLRPSQSVREWDRQRLEMFALQKKIQDLREQVVRLSARARLGKRVTLADLENSTEHQLRLWIQSLKALADERAGKELAAMGPGQRVAEYRRLKRNQGIRQRRLEARHVNNAGTDSDTRDLSKIWRD